MGFYDQPQTETYTFSAVNFATTKTFAVKGPAGKHGKVLGVMPAVTTSFVGTTTPGRVQVGLSGDLDAYADLAMGAAGAGTAAGAALRAEGTADIPANTAVLVTCVAPTGGSPAGVAEVAVTIGWY